MKLYIRVKGHWCYHDFVENCWRPKDEAPWPLSRECAEISGWNAIDRFAAINILTKPVEDLETEPDRSGRSRGVFGLSVSPK
jgi:hypothetical protein